MKHIIQFSGGKDSTALVLWAKENLPEFTAVFCDTGWEHPLTYAYVQHINETQLDGKLVTLKNEKFPNGMRDLVFYKKRPPSTKARFCTEELKVKPFAKWLKEQDTDDPIVYQGIRGEESASRMAAGRRMWNDLFDAWVERPLFDWTARDVFEMHRKHGVGVNPLYKMGAGRVGHDPAERRPVVRDVVARQHRQRAHAAGAAGQEPGEDTGGRGRDLSRRDGPHR